MTSPSSTSRWRRPAFRAADHAVLARLRAIALLLHAVRGARPESFDLDIALTIDREGAICPLESIGWDSCLHLAETMGWHDLLTQFDVQNTYDHELYPHIFARTAKTEFPDGCPPGLTHLLREIRGTRRPSDTAMAFLAQANWAYYPVLDLIHPLLPDQVSAHEALEALVQVEGVGGLGDGPLGLLAREAVALITRTPGAFFQSLSVE